MIVNLIILCLIIISSICLWCYKECDTKLKYIMLSFGAILFIIQLQKLLNNNMNENFDSTDAKEALQNIASVYNDGVLTVSKLNVTGDLAVTGKSSFGGDITSAKKITTTDASIGNQLFFTNKDDTAQKETWIINNWANRLHFKSTKANTGGIITETNLHGDGTITTSWYQPSGSTRMTAGTGSAGASIDRQAGFLQIYDNNANPLFFMGNGKRYW
jgi:hypothetical protein